MAYFEFLQQQDEQGLASPRLGFKKKNPQLQDGLPEGLQVQGNNPSISPPLQEGAPQDGNVEKVRKLHKELGDAQGELVKVSRENEVFGVTAIQPILDNLSKGTPDPESYLKVADDFRTVAAQNTTPGVYAKQLLSAADKLSRAYQSHKELQELRKPFGPLAITPQENEQQKESLQKQLAEKKAQLETTGSLRTPQIQKEVSGLEQSLARIQSAEKDVYTVPTFDQALAASGMNREDFVKRISEASGKYADGGWNLNAPITGGFAIAMTNMMKSMGEGGMKALRDLAAMGKKKPREQGGEQQQTGAKQPEGRTATIGTDPYESRIRAREARQEQILQELGQLQDFKTTGDVLTFILFSLILGAPTAAVLFTNKAKRGTLRAELDQVNHDIDRYMRKQDNYRRMQETARHNAAMEAFRGDELRLADRREGNTAKIGAANVTLRKAELDETRRWHDEDARIRRSIPRGSDKQLDALMKDMRMREDEYKEAKDLLSNMLTDVPKEMLDEAKQNLPNLKGRAEAARDLVRKYLYQNHADMYEKLLQEDEAGAEEAP